MGCKHYSRIKNYGYNTEKSGGDYIFAFFPFFPLIWKITNLPPIGILFLNYIFFSSSILILLKLFSEPKSYARNVILSLSLPSIIIFLIPYTEATFMLMVSIGIYGFIKNKYWIFFIGFLLASLTRPSFTFLLLSIIGTEFFYLIKHKKIKIGIKNTLYRISPLLIGTIIVSLIQYTQGSGDFFKFIKVQKYWNNILSIPHNLRDWSQESFGINIGVIFFIFIPLLILIFQLLYKQLKENKKKPVLNYKSPKDYLLILSMLYLIGNSLFIILFRGGSLHCLFRFTICSPFLYILLYIAFDYIRHISLNFRLFSICSLTLSSLLVLGLADYSTYWNFSDFGIFVFIASLFFWLFQDLKSCRIYKNGIILLLLVNLVWTTYLFNTYIINGWIFA
ncbi:MAG: hypothetical protein IMY72_00500 [Bacteroidetes bacterium]|nr:hypothetical protein [Bacteroidota bacterium]